MKKFAAVMVVGLLAACRPGPPTPVPTPTPPPPPPALDLNRVLRVAPNSTRLTLLDGTPFSLDMGVQCCMPAPAAVGNSRWPMASESQMDYFRGYGLNTVHFRLGPFYGDVDHESEWADTGGAYVAAGPDFNPAFWSKVEALVQYAYDHTMWVEVNPIDTWYCKHAASNWGDQPMPWPQADIDACGIAMTPVQERYLRHAVRTLGRFPNIIWTTDNEGGEIRGTKREWYVAVASIIRDEEAVVGLPVHLVGINNTDFADGPFDYVSTHDRAALVAPIAGKWTLNNERNPEFTAEQEISNFKRARDAGLSYSFWRAEMSEATMVEVLEGYKAVIGGDPVVVGCFPPADDDPKWVVPPVVGGGMSPETRKEVDDAKVAVGERCGTDHAGSLATIELVAAELRRKGECSGRLSDALFIKDGAVWKEIHVVTFASGCWSQDPANTPKSTWTYSGASGTGCSTDPGTVDFISCKLHQSYGLWDCTPKINGGPVRPEGDPERAACEAVAMGGRPSYVVTGAGLSLELALNPMQFILRGSGSGTLSCTTPRAGAVDLCYATPVSR